MVRITRYITKHVDTLQVLTKSRYSQGNPPYRLVYLGWRCQGSQNTNQKLDFDYFLRGCGYLRCYHGHHLHFQA